MEYYASLPSERKRFITAWTPVVLSVTQGFAAYPDVAFAQHIPYFFQCFISLLRVPISYDQQLVLQRIFERVGELYKIPTIAPIWENKGRGGSLSEIAYTDTQILCDYKKGNDFNEKDDNRDVEDLDGLDIKLEKQQ